MLNRMGNCHSVPITEWETQLLFSYFYFYFLYWETQLNGKFLGPSRKTTETTLWWRKHDGEGFFFFFLWWFFFSSGLTVGNFRQTDVCSDTKTDARQPEQSWNNRKIKNITSELALRPCLESAPSGKTTRSQHQTKRDQTAIVFIHQNINYLLKEYNRLLIKDY